MLRTVLMLAAFVSLLSAQSEVEALKARVESLERELVDLKRVLAALEAKAAPAAPSPPAPPPQTPAQKPRETVHQNDYSVARLDNVPIDPQLKGFFHVPGTETMMRFGGYIKLDFMYDLRYAGFPDYFQPSSFPQSAPYTSPSTNFSARQTRLSYEIRRPVSGSPLRFYIEGDFLGTNSTSFRLRHAYAQWRNLLAGQTWSLFTDVDTFPDSLEFNGPVSKLSRRNPQVRYSFRLPRGRSFAVSTEKPMPDVQTPVMNTAITDTALTPDFVLQYRQNYEHGHFQTAMIIRSVGGFAPGIGVRHVPGYGVSLSGVLRTRGTNNLAFEGAIGRGISNVILDQEGQHLDAGLNSSGHVAATPAGGFHATYQHHWSPRWRSSVVYSYAKANNLASQPASFYRASHYMLGNLLWAHETQPLLIGGEFIYGWLVRKDLSTYSVPRIQLSVQYDFIK